MQLRIGYLRQFGKAVLVSALIAPAAAQQRSLADDPVSPPQWCTKAKTKVEKLICEGGQLGEFDQELAVYYENLLKMVEPSAKPDLVQSQKKWIAEREQCAATAKETEDLVSCVETMIQQRTGLLAKDIQEKNIERRLSEFAKFKLKTFKNTAFEFQYPSSWHLETAADGRISLTSEHEDEEMTLGFEKTLTSSKNCTYSEEGLSLPESRGSFYEGKKQIGGQEFDSFDRGWIPSGEDRHYYGFFNGRCFAIHVSDNSQARSSRCWAVDDARGRASCGIGELEIKDLMAYSEGVIRTVRFVDDQK
jgi:uncharacterized protein